MSATNWFSQGYDKVNERAKELEENANRLYLPEFFLRPDEEATITIVNRIPLNLYEHYLKQSGRYLTCSKDDCVLCATGNKASFRSAYLIIDHRYEEWEDKKTHETKKRQNTLKIAKFGIRAAKTLGALDKKKSLPMGLETCVWEVTRTGTGNDTNYTFLPIMDGERILPSEEQMHKKQPMELIAEVLKPKDKEYLLKVLSGSGVATGATSPASGGARPNLDLSDDGDDGEVPFDL